MKSLALLTLVGWLFVSRLVRWLALYQQKEYRLDRFRAFLKTPEGKTELFSLFSPGVLKSPKSWKRPKITARVLLISLGTGMILLVGFVVVFVLFASWQQQVMAALGYFVLSYLFIPVLVGAVTAVTSFPARGKVWWELFTASQKIMKQQPLIIGVGGSYGKTSTKYLLAALLKQKYSVFMTPKSFNTAYSVAHSINQHYQGEAVVLLEYGAYKRGEIASLTKWFPPSHVVITGFTEQHLDLFGSVLASLQAESELVAAVPAHGTVWWNGDDPRVPEIVAQVPKLSAQTVKYQAADLGSATLTQHGQLELALSEKITTQLVGKHYLTNLAAAVAVAHELQVTHAQIEQAVRNFVPDERFVRSYAGTDCWILDDAGTSNPEGFRTTLELAEVFPEKHKVLLTSGIVDLGPASEQVHRQLAEQANSVVDLVLYVGSAGKEQFQQQLAEKCLVAEEQIIAAVKQAPKDCLLIIEGRMPGWIVPTLQQKGVK